MFLKLLEIGDIGITIKGIIYTEGDINLVNLLNNKKVRVGLNKERIVKNKKKTIYWAVLISNEENKKKQFENYISNILFSYLCI